MRLFFLYGVVFCVAGLLLADSAAAARMSSRSQRGKTISVLDYGARPDDGQDDTKSVRDAIEACRQQPGARLVFPKGVYDFFEASAKDRNATSMTLDRYRNFTIIADGATWMFHGLVRPMTVGWCERIAIRGVTIDYERPPFSIGEVVESRKKYFDVTVFDAYPVRGGEPVQAFMDYDPETNLPRRGCVDVYHSVKKTELVEPQRLRVHLKRNVKMKTGAWVVLRHQVYQYNAFMFVDCSNVSLQNVTVYTAPGMGLYARSCRNVSLDHFNVRIKPDSKRLMSTTADAVHFKACQGMVRLKNCIFEGMGDDAVNVGNCYVTIREIVDERTVVAAHRRGVPATLEAKDRVEFLHPETLLSYATGTVKTVEPAGQNNVYRIEMSRPLPKEIAKGHVLGNVTRVPKLQISKCTVRNNRARGFLIQTRNAVIEDCTFENCTFGGLWVMTEIVYFDEGVGTRNVVVRNNTFTNCNYAGPVGEGVLSIFAYLKDFAFPPKPGVHRNIVLENNTIRGSDNAGIFVAGAENVVLRGNRITDACRQPKSDPGRAAIYVMSTRQAAITGNHAVLDEQGEGCQAVLRFGPGCEKDTISVTGNEGF